MLVVSPDPPSNISNRTAGADAPFWLAAIADSSDDAIVAKDLDGVVTYWNKAAEVLFGYTFDEIVGRPITCILPSDRMNEEASILARVRRGEKTINFETERQRKDGLLIPVSLTISPIRDAENTIIGATKVARDLTERDGHAARLMETKAALLALQAETKVGASNLLAALGELASSQADAKNVKADLLTAVTALAASREETKTCIADLLMTETALALSRAETKSTESDLLVAVASLADAQANTDVGVVAMLASETALALSKADTKNSVADLLAAVTALAQAREETKIGLTDLLVAETLNASLARLSQHLAAARDRSERANRAKSGYIAGMSHELRTPLNSIIGYAHLLKIGGGLDHIQEARVDAMLASGKHLLEMIVSVLDLSEIEAEHIRLKAVDVDPKAVAASCLDFILPSAEEKGLTLTLATPPDVPVKIRVDPTRLRQLLLNLLGNAVKFTSRGGVTLHLRTVADGSLMRIDVADTGPGIPADQHELLFRAFSRLDIEATSRVEGAGLGLAISSRLATLMGGRLGHSDNPGGGSVFWLELPVNAIANSLSEPASSLASSANVKQLLHVLVVDDVFMNRDIAGAILRAGGHVVTSAEDGAQAVAVAASADFDVILMDVRMPVMDGLEATRRIRVLEGERGRVPIVAMTAQAFTDQIAECHKAGMNSHLAKPFDPDTLLAVVAKAKKIGMRGGESESLSCIGAQ